MSEVVSGSPFVTMYQIADSSNIKAIGYVTDTSVLFVEFLPGRQNHTRTYGFQNVPLDVVTRFLTAKSKGKFFATHIKGQFDPLWVADEK